MDREQPFTALMADARRAVVALDNLSLRDGTKSTGRAVRDGKDVYVRLLKGALKAERQEVRGVGLDAETRCVHYHSTLDVVAIRMACCSIYYACKDCHDMLADRDIRVWPRSEWSACAALCRACGCELTIHQYMNSGCRCPHCNAGFNPVCRNHYHFYFESEGAV